LIRLRQAKPQARITLLTSSKLQDLWRGHSAIDSVLTFEPGESVWTVARRLKREGFTIGLALPNSPRSAMELWLARIPQRIGYASRWRRLFLTLALPAVPGAVSMKKLSASEIRRRIENPHPTPAQIIPAAAHQIFHYLHLVKSLGAVAQPLRPELFVTESETSAFLNRFGLPLRNERPLFGMNPGAEYGPAKRWPVERYVAAGVEVQKRTHCRWLIFGGGSDRPIADEIAAGLRSDRGSGKALNEAPGVVNLAGETTLRELCAGLKVCRVLLSNDTGPMHVAAALGTPVVAPFGSTSPELTAPGLPGDPKHRLLKAGVPCSPCFLRECPIDFRCMTGISVDAVIQEILQVWKCNS